MSRKTSWTAIEVRLASSRPRVILRDTMVRTITTSSSRIANSVTVVVSPSPGIRPFSRANSPWAAALAQPPQMKAKKIVSSENGTHSLAPGGTRPKPTIGTSPVAIT